MGIPPSITSFGYSCPIARGFAYQAGYLQCTYNRKDFVNNFEKKLDMLLLSI